MGHASEIESRTGPQAEPSTAKTLGGGYVFGVPVGDLGWFGSLLIGLALGFIAFFGFTFLGIVGILIYNGGTHGSVDLALSYRRFGLIAGIVVMAISLSYLGTLWVRRVTRKG